MASPPSSWACAADGNAAAARSMPRHARERVFMMDRSLLDVDRPCLLPYGPASVAGRSFQTVFLLAKLLRCTIIKSHFCLKNGLCCKITDRKRVVKGRRGSVRVDLGGRRIIKKKRKQKKQ